MVTTLHGSGRQGAFTAAYLAGLLGFGVGALCLRFCFSLMHSPWFLPWRFLLVMFPYDGIWPKAEHSDAHGRTCLGYPEGLNGVD